MENDPANLNDDQLDAMLRDVEIPSDLLESLREIPAELTTETIQKSNRPSRTKVVLMVLAASVLAAAFLVPAWLANNPNNNLNVAGIEDRESAKNKNSVAGNTEKELLAQLAEMDREIDLLNDKIERAEMNAIFTSDVARESSSSSTDDQNDINSMVIALTDQVSLSLGGNDETVRFDMAQVIRRFPGTRGARIAHDYLETSEK